MSHEARFSESMRNPAAYPHPVAGVELIETHISWVLLTGSVAYKIKKPVRLDFVDFSTLERRQQACLDELRLNRRFAPQIYQDIVAIGGTTANPRVGGDGPPIEYAVKMSQFPSLARLDRVLARGEFRPEDCDQLAAAIADSHRRVPVAAADSAFGNPDKIAAIFADVLATARHEMTGGLADLVEKLETWAGNEAARLRPVFERRKTAGYIRECHGDLHSENIVMLAGKAVPFDCLEFREDLRWIDCASDIAFLTMDLTDRRHPALAHRLLAGYLEQTGDTGALAVLRYYQAYRAVVRAVVAVLQQAGVHAQARSSLIQRAREYLDLAINYTRPLVPSLVITYGVSGTGKTTFTSRLIEQTGAIRLRSDIERRRSDTRSPTATSPGSSADADERYSIAARQAVYNSLLAKAAIGLDAGYTMIIDATFLKRTWRDAFRALAQRQGIAFVILEFDADRDTLRQRVFSRQRQRADASEATVEVLERQFAELEPLADDERPFALNASNGDLPSVLHRLKQMGP